MSLHLVNSKEWKLTPEPDAAGVEKLCKEINVSGPVGKILYQRNITNLEEAKYFFRPSLDDLHDPFLMQDMDKAVKRLQKAIAQREKILVYGDYDVDGTTAVSLFYGFLSKHYDRLDHYIPDRYQEGYGLSFRGVDYAEEEGCKLVVTLDCGIKAHEKIEYGNQKGIDFIVCDHHKPGVELPPAHAVLDPKRDDCAYPYDELTGCSIGFKFLQAFCQAENIPEDGLFQYLDLTAISTACDIVPVLKENRILLKHGLDFINNSPRAGIKALIEVAGYKSALNVTGLVFGIGPRINAAGRIAHANLAVKLLLAEDAEEAAALAAQINTNNDRRKAYDEEITAEALKMIEEERPPQAKTSVLFKNDWHKGVIGIVASRCIEQHYRPTIILTESNGKATGSARSVPGYDIYEAISACSDLLLQFGGHKYAAGLTLELDKVPAFIDKFEAVVGSDITEEQLIPKVKINALIDLNQINPRFFKVIEQMAPFGPGNMRPVFASQVAVSAGRYRLLKEKHLKMTVHQPGQSIVFDAIGFDMAHFYDQIVPEEPFFLCYTIEENTYMDRKSLQLYIKDIKKEWVAS